MFEGSKTGRPASRTQYFQGSSRQRLEKCLFYSIFYAFHTGTSLGKGAFSPNWYQYETRRILHKVHVEFFITMAPPTKTLAAPGKPSPPHQVCAVSLGSLHCVHCKKTGCFCSQNRREKSIFECTIGAARFFCCVVFPTNEYNDGHPYLRQWLLLVLVPMIVYIAKRLIILVPKSAEKSPFLNARGAISAVSFSLRTSTTMSIHAFGKDCLLFYFQ